MGLYQIWQFIPIGTARLIGDTPLVDVSLHGFNRLTQGTESPLQRWVSIGHECLKVNIRCRHGMSLLGGLNNVNAIDLDSTVHITVVCSLMG